MNQTRFDIRPFFQGSLSDYIHATNFFVHIDTFNHSLKQATRNSLLKMKTKSKDRRSMNFLSSLVGTSASSVGLALITFLSGVLIARALGPEARAEYGSIILISQMAATLGTLSFFDGSIVQSRRAKRDVHALIPTLLTVAIALAGFAIFASILSFSLYDWGFVHVSNNFLYFFTAMIVLSHAFWTTFGSAERAQMKFLLVNVTSLTAPLSFSILLFTAWFLKPDAISVTLVLSLFLISKIPVLVFWTFEYRRWIFGEVDTGFARNALGTGLSLHLAVALNLIISSSDRLIGIATWSKEVLGQYFVAFSAVGAGFAILTAALRMVLLPYMSGILPSDLPFRLAQIIRLTILAVIGILIVGLIILPYMIPLLYGSEYSSASDYALWLLFSFSIIPIRTVMLEAGRSLGKGLPSVEMALVSFGVLGIGYFTTGYDSPEALIVTLFFSNIASTFAGARHLVRGGNLRLDRSLLPSADDLRLIASILKKTFRGTTR